MYKFLWFNVLVKERVNKEDRMLRFVQYFFKLAVTLWAAASSYGDCACFKR